jgi:hypothetical protein
MHIWGAEVFLHSFLTAALDGGKGSPYRVGHFIQGGGGGGNPAPISYGG